MIELDVIHIICIFANFFREISCSVLFLSSFLQDFDYLFGFLCIDLNEANHFSKSNIIYFEKKVKFN